MMKPPQSSTLFPYTTLFRSPRKTCYLGTRAAALLPRPHSRLGQHGRASTRSEEHTSELQSHVNLVCRLLLEKKNKVGEKTIYEISSFPLRKTFEFFENLKLQGLRRVQGHAPAARSAPRQGRRKDDL